MTRLGPADVLSLGLLGVRTRKARAALSALGIAIGIATLVLVTGIPAASAAALDRQLAAMGVNRLQATPVPDREPPVLLPTESVDMVARIAPVTVASAVGDFGAQVGRSDRAAKGDFNALAVLAAKTNLLRAVNGRLRTGRFLDDAVGHFPTVVLGSVAAERLGFTDLNAGGPAPQVFIGKRFFTIVGILDAVPLSPEIDRSVLVGWTAATEFLRFNGHPTRIYLQTTEDQVEAVRDVLAATVNPRHPGDVLVSRPSDALAAKRAARQTFGALFLGLGGVALLVGGIGVANTMYISVLERRREIGLRRALGANRGQVRLQFLTESMVLSLMGGAGGVLGGALATAAYCATQDWPFVLPTTTTVGGLVGTLVIGVLAGGYPAIRAARMHPTEALATV